MLVSIGAMIYNFLDKTGNKKPKSAEPEVRKDHINIEDQLGAEKPEKAGLLTIENDPNEDDTNEDAFPDATPAMKV